MLFRSALHHKSEWAVSGAVKGLAFIWASGEHDVAEEIGDAKWSYICSKDTRAEKNAQYEAVDNMMHGRDKQLPAPASH